MLYTCDPSGIITAVEKKATRKYRHVIPPGSLFCREYLRSESKHIAAIALTTPKPARRQAGGHMFITTNLSENHRPRRGRIICPNQKILHNIKNYMFKMFFLLF
jgi:hypothetical protein